VLIPNLSRNYAAIRQELSDPQTLPMWQDQSSKPTLNDRGRLIEYLRLSDRLPDFIGRPSWPSTAISEQEQNSKEPRTVEPASAR
jgi:hypothetical protein